MDIISPTTIKQLLSKYETRPSKGLGQNFLIDAHVLEKICSTSDIKQTDTILEVGPGMGVLTKELATRAGEVIAVEKDQTMVNILTDVLNASNIKNVKIVNDDILKIEKLEKFKNYKVVANIPYYLTSPLIRKFLEAENKPEFMVLMIQKEVAQRICAKPGQMSLLAVSVQFYAEPKIVSYVSKNCFYPAPKIDSAIIKLKPHSLKHETNSSFKLQASSFFTIVKAGFSQPRKQLAGNLSKALKLDKNNVEKWLLENNIKPTQRAETLSIEDWKNLTKSFSN